MNIFVTGGCKNGKSTHAERLAVAQRGQGLPLYYLATMLPADEEDNARIARHRAQRRGLGFTTLELPRNLAQLPPDCNRAGSFLLDSTTALLSNEMFCNGTADATAAQRVAADLNELLDSLQNLVIVSDWLGSDAVRYDPLTEQYRAGLAALDRLCARRCEVVLEVCLGALIYHKGGEQYEACFGSR
ncbi:MAG: bifunctional adenosylcobinamide kinase/adenosylcobinamide-phosphate guanylyltransferase [Angelakisella sp.]